MTFLELKATVRTMVWPAGEARSRRTTHDKHIVDALVEIQRLVKCWQQNHTNLIRHCDTLFNCGLTSFELEGDGGEPARGIINRLGVIDKINPTTNLEDANSPDEYCSEIEYARVDFCVMRDFLARSAKRGCCVPLHSFFGLPFACLSGKGKIPVPTDEGVSEDLPDLPLGYHYPQTSTDYTRRARRGLWSMERGRFYVLPWIQSTETILLRWDGIKRKWSDGDPIEDDPTLINAIYLYVLAAYEKFENRDAAQAGLAERDFQIAIQGLWADCSAESMIRGCESSHARAAL